MRHAAILSLALVSAGCGGGAKAPDSGMADDGPAAAQDASADLVTTGASDGAAGDLAPALVGPAVVGKVADESGKLLSGAVVRACSLTRCLVGKSDASGAFSFQMLEKAAIAVNSPEITTTTPRHAESLVPIALTDDSTVDVGTIYVPNLPTGAFLGPTSSDPQTVMVGDGLELTVRRAALTAPLGDLDNNIAARAVPLAHVPSLPLGGETVVAVYALFPYGMTSSTPIALRLPTTLPAGTAVSLRTTDPFDGHLSPPVAAHSDGNVIASDSGQGIATLTWLIVSR